MSYYVCIQWPSDERRIYRGPGHENAIAVYVTAGPYSTQTEAHDVSNKLQKAKDRFWDNPDVGTDQGKYFVRTENDLLQLQNRGETVGQFNGDGEDRREPLVLPSFMGGKKIR